MSNAEWNEIKRLAADFQKAQLSTSEQKLSERNCVEIINKLLESKLLNVIYTVDGKEYVTPDQLAREIRDELYVGGGRITLVELAQLLNVDITQITERAAEIRKSIPGCSVILGQLIDQTYLERIAVDIDERLSEHGKITVGDLSQDFDLPAEFLQSVIERHLGKIIHGKQDKTNSRNFFTSAFISRNRACIRGAFSAVTKPISINALLTQCGVEEGIFFSIVEELIKANEVPGTVSGKRGENGIYVPTIYSRTQSEWVNSFYRQNGYLEYDALTRLDISDPRTFIRKHFPNDKLMFLSSCAVGPNLFEMVEGSIEDAVASGSFVDVMPILPSVFEPEDADTILKDILKQKDNKSLSYKLHIFCQTIAVTDIFLQRMDKNFDDVIKSKAEKAVSSGLYQQFQAETKLQQNRNNVDDEVSEKTDKREERRKKATGGKGGGGTQGRETKMKSTKKKHQRGKAGGDDSDSDTPLATGKATKGSGSKFELLSTADIKEVIEGEELLMEDDLETFVEELTNYLYPSLNKRALAATETVFELSMASSAQIRRKVHSELQDKLNSMVVNVRMFEKGIKNFTHKETQQQLAKYLLKTLCTEIANEIFGFVAQENMIQYDQTKEMTIEMRQKIMSELPASSKDVLMTLHKSLAGDSLDAFLTVCEPALGTGVCDMVLRKHDKKKERPLAFGHRAALLEQLHSVVEPSAVLLIAALVVFQTVTQTMLHASGRFVSQILSFIRPSLTTEAYVEMSQFYDLVMKMLTTDGDTEQEAEILATLTELTPKIKEIAMHYKKPSSADKTPAE